MNVRNRRCLGLALVLVVATSGGAAAKSSSSGSWPVIKVELNYTGMNWETSERVDKSLAIVDREPFLPAKNLPCPAPRATARSGRLVAAAIPLSATVNREEFGDFTAGQEALLSRNGFVVIPGNSPQMFYIYEENVYANLPNFVTTDIVLHTWSDLFRYILKKVEKRRIFGQVTLLSRGLTDASVKQYRTARDPRVREAALRNAAYFAVAEALLDRKLDTRLPADVRRLAQPVLERIRRASGKGPCFIGGEMDYTLFIPRGHYTLCEDWKNLFRAMNWYGESAFTVPDQDEITPEMLQAELLVQALDTLKVSGQSGWSLWDGAYDLTSLFTGPSNYLTPRQVREAMKKVYGSKISLAALGDPQKGAAVVRELRALPESLIVKQTGADTSPRQVRFMGKRYVLDTLIMQRLVKYPERPLSSGLDVMAALGFRRAATLQEKEAEAWPPYAERMRQVRAFLAGMTDADWMSGVYPGTLWTLAALNTEGLAGRPWFMTTPGWLDKTLNTFGAGWAELRHNTILYAESYAAEGGGEEYAVKLPKGYIEPNDLFFSRMLWLARKMRAEISKRGCLTAKMKERLELFIEINERCGAIVDKELQGEKLNEEEYRFIHFIGSKFAEITTGCLACDGEAAGWDEWSLPEAEKDMAVIADVGTSDGTAHEVASGRAQEIYAIVPGSKGPRLTRGACYQFHEFAWPAGDRLTDQKWRALLDEGKAPAAPAWCRGYLSGDTKPTRPDQISEFGFFRYTFDPD